MSADATAAPASSATAVEVSEDVELRGVFPNPRAVTYYLGSTLQIRFSSSRWIDMVRLHEATTE